MNSKTILKTGAVICGLSVIIGAFGAHALRSVLEANDRVSPYETGVLYQMFHGLAILAVGVVAKSNASKWITRSFWCMLLGIILFSGSLYGLAIWEIGFLGPITPIGGVFFIIGWVCLFIGVQKQ